MAPWPANVLTRGRLMLDGARHMYLGQPRGGPHGDRVFDPKILGDASGHVKIVTNSWTPPMATRFTWMIAPSIATSTHPAQISCRRGGNEIETLYGSVIATAAPRKLLRRAHDRRATGAQGPRRAAGPAGICRA